MARLFFNISKKVRLIKKKANFFRDSNRDFFRDSKRLYTPFRDSKRFCSGILSVT